VLASVSTHVGRQLSVELFLAKRAPISHERCFGARFLRDRRLAAAVAECRRGGTGGPHWCVARTPTSPVVIVSPERSSARVPRSSLYGLQAGVAWQAAQYVAVELDLVHTCTPGVLGATVQRRTSCSRHGQLLLPVLSL
jgi:hypothetical protein